MNIDFYRNIDYEALYKEVITAVSKIEKTASLLEKQNSMQNPYEIKELKNKINDFFTALNDAKLISERDRLTIENINAKLIVCEEKLKFFEKLLNKKKLPRPKKTRSLKKNKDEQRD